ncbi:MAG: response regulator transcription factor [Tannerella sp.]|nr:response regulator transcription factor [Tannerella sp.]
MITIHITDDSTMFVEALIPFINASGIALVTGYSLRLSDCRDKLASYSPSILLLDINMTDGDGMMFCAEIHKLYPQIKIITLTGHTEYSIAIRMLKNGASGYVVKNEIADEILNAIRTVTHGNEYISPQIRRIADRTTQKTVVLTPLEKLFLQMIVTGMSNRQIAEQMNVALSTILSFHKKLNLKLNASNPTELIANARRESNLIE